MYLARADGERMTERLSAAWKDYPHRSCEWLAYNGPVIPS